MRTGMSDEYLGWHFHTGKEQHGSRHKIVDNVGEIVRQLLDLQLVTGGAVLGHLHDYTRLSSPVLSSHVQSSLSVCVSG